MNLSSSVPAGGDAVDAVLAWLRVGREAAFAAHGQVLAHLLANAFGSRVVLGSSQGRVQFCTFSRLPLHLRGFAREEVRAVIVAESDTDWMSSEPGFWKRVTNATDLPFVFACGETEYHLAQKRVGGNFALVWHPDQIVEFLTSPRPLDYFRSMLRGVFSPAELHPFDHHHPVADAAFRGRQDVLRRLRDHPRTNYALIGPSKMGKTSLVRRYMQPGEHGAGSRDRMFYLDLYPVPATDAGLARALRMRVDPGAAAYYDAPENIAGFLEKARSRLDGPLEIILDEVDRHCGLALLRTLVHLTQKSICRLLLVGRWRLMKEAVHVHDDNFSRLEPIILQPFSVDEAAELLEKPLADLGLRPERLRHELRSAANRLGRVPGHLQEFGSFLVEELLHTGDRLTQLTVRLALDRVITAPRLNGLLDDLSSTRTRVSALLVALGCTGGDPLDPMWLQGAFRERGIDVRVRDCLEMCNELVIHHLLGYHDGVFRICRWDFIAEGKMERHTYKAMLEDEIRSLR